MTLRLLLLFLLLSQAVSSQKVIATFLQNQQHTSIAIDNSGSLWLVDDYGNFTSYDGRSFATISTGVKGCKLVKDSKSGIVYAQCNSKCYTIEKDRLIPTNKQLFDQHLTETDVNLPLPGFSEVISTKTYLTESNYILSGTNGLLYIGNNDEVKEYMIPDLPPLYNISQLTKHKGSIYIATKDQGLYIWNEPNYFLHHIDTFTQLSSNTINGLTFDLNGHCWLITNEGVNVVQLDDRILTEPPLMQLHSVTQGNDVLEMSNPVELTPSHENLIIRYGAIDLLHADQVEYQWSLDPTKEGSWSPLLTSTEVVLESLDPGAYSFQVRATVDRKYFSFSDRIRITVQDNFWNSYWPWIFGGLALLGLFWLLSYLYYDSTISTLTKQRDKIILENQLLKSKQKALQLQMNPHFLFNSLSAVQGLIALKKNKKARKHLQSFSQLMRLMLDQSRSEKISLEDEVRFLDHYLSLEKMARNDRFEYDILIDDDVEEDVFIPPMILQPIIENAIVHGMKGLQRKGDIEVSISTSKDGLLCSVEDNGVGMGVAIKGNHTSHGMDILKERIRVHKKGGSKDPITIIDKNDEEGMSTGTIVKINLPIL